MKSPKERYHVCVNPQAYQDAKAEAELKGVSLTAWVSMAVRQTAELNRALRAQQLREGPEFRPLDEP